MIINLQELIALLPVLILILSIVIVILSISYSRSYRFTVIFTVLSLILTLVSLYFITDVLPININNLFFITQYSLLYIGMIIVSSISGCIFSYSWLLKYPFNKEEFYVLILLSTIGAIALTVSNNMSSLFISIELMSLPLLGLISYSHYYKYALETSFKYLILSGVSSAFLLLGISWIYAVSGNFLISSINNIFNFSSNSSILMLLFGIIMVFISFLFKLSLVPFHLWVSDIYQRTPAAVLSFFSISGKIAIFGFLLNFFSYFSILQNTKLHMILLLISIFSIFFGNIMALFQNNIKRFFGYSSISQIGYLLIIFLVSKNDYFFSLEASGIYLFNYLLTNIAYFGIINLVSHFSYNHLTHNDIDTTDSYKGLFWSQPILALMITIVFLSLSGVPITLGFWGKFYIFSIILKNHFWIIGSVFCIGTIFGFLGYIRLIINLYLCPIKSISCIRDIKISHNWYYSTSGILILFVGIIILILGLYPSPLINLIQLMQKY